MSKNKILSGGGKNLIGGGKWGRRGREVGEKGEGSGGKGGGNWEWGTPLSTPSLLGYVETIQLILGVTDNSEYVYFKIAIDNHYLSIT